jgi:PAS domain S-box-containing protein
LPSKKKSPWGKMKAKMEQFPAKNPNPVLSVEKDGTVLYSNEAGEPLLNEWGVRVGEKLPSSIGDIVKGVIYRNSPEKMEVKVGKRVYLVVFHPFHDEEFINVSGFDISEQKELEERNRENENKYRQIVTTAQEGIWTADTQGRITYVNRIMSNWLGYSVEELLGENIFKFVSKEDLESVYEHWKARIEGIMESFDIRLKKDDGSHIWVTVNISPLQDAQGNFVGNLSMFSNITQRKEIESMLKETLDNLEKSVKERTAELERAYNLLKESEKGLSEAQKMAHMGNWEWNLTTGELHGSDETYCIFGLTSQIDIKSDEILNSIHPDDRDHVDASIKKALSGNPCGIDFRIIQSNGEERVVHTD